jgi:large subunit ribosomal protein L2
MVSYDYGSLTKTAPFKPLTKGKKRVSGRDSQGRISVRHKGGAHKRKYRIIDFKRNKEDIEGKIITIEYDPCRNSFISLISYKDGEKKYIVTPDKVNIGQTILSAKKAPIQIGNSLLIANIPLGTVIHNIELKPGKGAQLARSAGTSGVIVAKEGKYAHVKLRSGEIRLILLECKATIGAVSNSDYLLLKRGKAGKMRWLGRRPTVRGVAMNPVDHPHGGGEGRTSGGRHPSTPWGKKTKGLKTRKNKRTSRYILNRR